MGTRLQKQSVYWNLVSLRFILAGPPENDIVLTSNKVSAKHGKFVLENGAWLIEDRAAYQETEVQTGLLYNDEYTIKSRIHDGDFARIAE